MKRLPLVNNWQCKRWTSISSVLDDSGDTSDWFSAYVPGTVHGALLAAKQIPDPFYGLNETAVQWIGESDWLYRCRFEVSKDVLQEDCLALCFDGLDTFATAWLNGQQIHISDNMFVPYRIQVRSLVQEGVNELFLHFESALRRGKEREAQYGTHAIWNGDASRVYVRKAQYHYGWDWGPTLLTAGPWKPVYIEAYSERLADLECVTDLADDLNAAQLHVNVGLERSGATQSTPLSLLLVVYAPGGEKIDEHTVSLASDKLQHTFMLKKPQLWWPRGYGEQPLYRIVVTLYDDAGELDRREQRLGLRRLHLVQRPLSYVEGATFFFSVNNTPIYCGGANWIPADSFLPTVSADRYRAWLQLAADAHMTMLRVWGGGVYEDDVFYDICDELGLLVWQDFLFGCGIYPALDWFRASVEAEVEAALRRLRHHPSIALWCGNNEDYSIAQSLHLYESTFTGDFTRTGFPARAIYEQLLPEMCARLDPQRPYVPGSPYGGSDANSEQQGDSHAWHVGNGDVPYQDYPKTRARFISEFGMESFPALATIERYTPPEEHYAQSRTIDFHNKSEGGSRRIVGYMLDNIRLPIDLQGYIYASQFIQAEAMGVAIRGWRRHWGHFDKQTGGALLWQLNDCWPVISWAIVDYYLRPKAAYYVVRREFAPLIVGLLATQDDQVEWWAVNGTLMAIEGEIVVDTWALDGTLLNEERQHAVLAANQGTELGSMKRQDTQVISVRLLQDGVTMARSALWPEPFKYLSLPEPEITIERQDRQTLQVKAQRPVKGVWLSARDGVRWSDNMLDVFPNDPQVIKAQGLGNSEVQVRFLK